MKNLDEVVFVESFLDGEFPAGFKRLQGSLRELLNDFKSMSGYVEYQFTNPLDGTAQQSAAMIEELRKVGILPVNLQIQEDDGYSEKMIFPAVIVTYKGRSTPVNILENNVASLAPGQDEVVLNNSISLLEYKLTNAIKKLKSLHKSKIAITDDGRCVAVSPVDSAKAA